MVSDEILLERQHHWECTVSFSVLRKYRVGTKGKKCIQMEFFIIASHSVKKEFKHFPAKIMGTQRSQRVCIVQPPFSLQSPK